MQALGKIPGGVTVEHFVQMRRFLEQILHELQSNGIKAKRVVSRLNNSDKEVPAPIFVGIVEDDDLAQKRQRRNEPDAGLFRFGDDNASNVYDETVRNRAGEVVARDWTEGTADKSSHARSLGPDIGCHHQRFIAIRIPSGGKRQQVGTITVGFEENPTKQAAKLKTILAGWAQDSKKSPLIKFLKDNFVLNGPKF